MYKDYSFQDEEAIQDNKIEDMKQNDFSGMLHCKF